MTRESDSDAAAMGLSPSAHLDTFCRDNLPPRETWPELIFDLPELAYPDRLNCAVALLDDVAERHGADRRCLLGAGEQWTYADLLERSQQVARVLVDDLGLVPGNRVLLRGPNNPWLVACWFGVLRAGGVGVAATPLLRPGELRVMAEICQPTIALCDARFLADLEQVAGPDLDIVAYGGDAPDDLVTRCAGRDGDFPAVQTAADDVALLAFTSGTTGRPKATMHFHRDVLAIADTFSRHVLQPSPDDLFTGTPPLSFTFGLGGLVVFPLHAGAATLLVERATPVEFADLIHEHGVTVLFTAPAAYRAMVAKADLLGSLRRCVSAGEALPHSVSELFHQATGVRIIDGIGSTEMLHIFVSAADGAVRPGATGVPVPGYRAAILDDAGNVLPAPSTGRLAVKGPTGCRYLADPRQTEYVQHGWNVTGDTYRQDEDGYFWFQARSDDMIVTSGYNVAAPEVEDALLLHADVTECGVVGVADTERETMVVKAYVVLRAGCPADAAKVAELQDFVKQQISPYKYPRQVEFVTELPRTSTGKLQRFRLRQPTTPGS